MGFFKTHVTTRADRISNFQMTVCDYGTPVPDICGTIKISPNVINWKDFYSREIRTTTKQGKSKTTNISYKYYVYTELALGEGVQDIGAIWVGDTKYSSLRQANSTNEAPGFPLVLNTTGKKSPFMAQKYPDQAVDYDGLAYLHANGGGSSGIYLGENSAAVPSYAFEVKGQLRNTGNGIDVNPADYIMHILRKINIWNGVDDESTVVANIDDFRLYCKEKDFLISSPSENNNQRKAQEIIKELCNLFDIYFFWSNDQFKIAIKDNVAVPGGEWKPNKTIIYDLGPDDMLVQNDGACVSFSRKDSSEVYNRFTVDFENRANDYESESVSYEFVKDIEETGLRQQSTIQGKYFYTRERAIKIAQMAAKKNARERNKYVVKLDWAYAILEPGDLVTLTDPVIGLEKKVAMVNSVTENNDSTISVELMEYYDGEYADGIIDIGQNDYNIVDYNIAPSPTLEPIIFQPPSSATLTGNELWIAIKGKDETWGGCNVMVANQDMNYQYAGQFRMKSSYGKLTSPMSISDTSFTSDINGDFENMLLQDAENASSMFWLDGECMSYQTCTYNSNKTWTFSGIIRGQHGTDITRHDAGSDVVFCNGSLYSMELKKGDFGRTLYFKFPSVNVFNANPQDESEADSYNHTIQKYRVPSSNDIIAYTRYYQTENAVSYSIQVEWTPPEIDNYARSIVYYKVQGKDEKWQFAGYGIDSLTIPNVTVGDTYFIAVCPEDDAGVSQTPDEANQTSILVATKAVTPNAPEGLSLTFNTEPLVRWNFVDNADVRFYEVRTNTVTGSVDGLIGRTNSNQLIANLKERKGTVYVYAYGVNKVYSLPASVEYNVPIPNPPKTPKLVRGAVNGFTVTIDPIPAGCTGANFYINDEKHFSTDNVYAYSNTLPGTYSVSVSYVDYFGEGTRSNTDSIIVTATISPDILDSESITIDKLDQAVKDTLEEAKQTAKDFGVLSGNVYTKEETNNKISTSITNFEKGTLSKYSTITQTEEAIKIAVGNIDVDMSGEEIVSAINLTTSGVKIDGKLLHVTGDTLFDKNVIVGGAISAGSITSDKLAAEDIILGGKLQVIGGAVTLNGDGLKVAEKDGSYSMFNYDGISFHDPNGNRYAMVKKQIIGTASDGQYVKFDHPWTTAPKVICTPIDLASYVNSYDGFNTVMQCFAYNVTTAGFNVRCRSILTAGTSGGVTPINVTLTGALVPNPKDIYIVPFDLPPDANITFNITLIASGSRWTSTIEGPLGYPIEVTYSGQFGVRAKIYVNGALKVTSKDVLPNGWSDKSEIVNLTVNKIPANAEVKVVCETWKIAGNLVAGGNIVINTLTSNMPIEKVVSTGKASFIAMDNSNSGYTVS